MTDTERKLLVLLTGWVMRLEEDLQPEAGRTSGIAAEIRHLLQQIEAGEPPAQTATDARLAKLEYDVRWLMAEVKSR